MNLGRIPRFAVNSAILFVSRRLCVICSLQSGAAPPPHSHTVHRPKSDRGCGVRGCPRRPPSLPPFAPGTRLYGYRRHSPIPNLSKTEGTACKSLTDAPTNLQRSSSALGAHRHDIHYWDAWNESARWPRESPSQLAALDWSIEPPPSVQKVGDSTPRRVTPQK